MQSVRFVAIVAVGGMANLWGSLFWGVTLTFLSLRGTFGSYDDAFFGSVLVAIMILAPEGVFARPVLNRLLAPLRKWSGRGPA
jgi:branched-chain amino acid transport system permease protein